MLGLRDFPKRTSEEKVELLGSEQRVRTLDNITTTTLPISKKEMKKGVVLEIIEKKLLSDEILRNYPIVYIGSGTDVEYPLALGGRNIVMVDPILEDEQAINELIGKIKTLTDQDVQNNFGKITFTFDFGSGSENVVVELATRPYDKTIEDRYEIPDNSGAIVLFASQGPSGLVRVDDNMKEKLVEGGVIIEDTTLMKKSGENVELGS